MHRFIAFLCVLLMLPCFSVAEDAVPAQVQDYFDVFSQKMGQTYELHYAASPSDYCAAVPALYGITAASRIQYDGFYYWQISDKCVLSVCMIGDRAAAYILDFEPINYVAAFEPVFSAIYNYLDAYAAWQKSLGGTGYKDFNGDSVMVNSNLLQYIYEADGTYGDNLLEFDEVCLSVLYSYLYRTAALQIFPRSAYEDLIVDGEALTAEQNHNNAVLYALFSEQYMLEKYLESKK